MPVTSRVLPPTRVSASIQDRVLFHSTYSTVHDTIPYQYSHTVPPTIPVIPCHIGSCPARRCVQHDGFIACLIVDLTVLCMVCHDMAWCHDSAWTVQFQGI